VLYKVTPMMPVETPENAPRKAREPGQPRKRRKTAVYDHEGHEILITLMCLKCRNIKPLAQFGLRKMGDGAIRNQPWCRTCRSGAGAKKPSQDSATPSVAPEASQLQAPPLSMASEGQPDEQTHDQQDRLEGSEMAAPL